MLASISKLSELSGLDRRTIAAKLADTPSRAGPKNSKLFDVASAMRVLFSGSASPDGPLDPQVERALLDRERRKQLEMVNAKTEGRLLDVDEVTRLWVEQIGIAKGRLLSLPARLAPAVIGLGDLRDIERTIRDAIHEALTELSTE